MWVKICGVRTRDAALAIAEAGADAVGLNFYASSPRSVGRAEAARIVAALPSHVEPVGLFVNASASEVRRTAAEAGVRTLQLHGDEPPELLAELADFRLIRAFRVGVEGLEPVSRELQRLGGAGVSLQACLVDASVPGAYGGTGVAAPWSVVRDQWRFDDWPPLVLAGGLTPGNVAEAIRECRPWGVDVAGGVESAPGEKSFPDVRRFIENARSAS